MVTKTGPSFADLFVCYIEKQIFEQYTGTFPALFGRLIDDSLLFNCGYPADLPDIAHNKSSNASGHNLVKISLSS